MEVIKQKFRSIPNDELVAVLSELLDRAKDGNLQGAAFVLLDDGRTIQTGWAGIVADNPTPTLGGLAVLSHRLLPIAEQEED